MNLNNQVHKLNSEILVNMSFTEIEKILNQGDFLVPRSAYVQVTPQLAREMLLRNKNNRTLNQSVLSDYTYDMKNGYWTIGNDAITFDEDGNLNNGQHRLNGVIKSDTVQIFDVKYGVKTNPNMDRPNRRSVSGNIRMCTNLPQEFSKASVVAMVNYILRQLNLNSKNINFVSEFMREYEKELYGYITEVGIGNKIRGSKYHNASVLSACFLAYANGVDADLLKHIKNTLNTGEYVYDNYGNDRFLPIVKLDRSYLPESSPRIRYGNFLKTMFAIRCVETNKKLTNKIKEIDNICYSIEFVGKSLIRCHEVKVENEKNLFEMKEM